jgi:hypothetical protein
MHLQGFNTVLLRRYYLLIITILHFLCCAPAMSEALPEKVGAGLLFM